MGLSSKLTGRDGTHWYHCGISVRPTLTTEVSIRYANYGFTLITEATGERGNVLALANLVAKWSWTISEIVLLYASVVTNIRFCGCAQFRERPIPAADSITARREWKR
jgi:hypothetical protein